MNALGQRTDLTTTFDLGDSNLTSNPGDTDWGYNSRGEVTNVNANSTLIWDGENRLIEAQVTGGGTATYSYDAQSRRIAETVASATKITIYDGWNPIAEYWSVGFQPASLTKSFTWGIDLSGSIQGAGGVGGLLAVTDSTGTYFPTYDGNGNITEYLDSIGNVSAHYEYDPFGKTTVATGPKANDFAHRFSTKPLDATTGLYYYGYRFYDPNTGRWPSRDPIGELPKLLPQYFPDVSLYTFVRNSPIRLVDLLGLVGWDSSSANDPNPDLPGTLSNCLGFAVHGQDGQYLSPVKKKNGRSFTDGLKPLGYKCYEIKNLKDCKCECDEIKIAIVLYQNDNKENKGKNPWDDSDFDFTSTVGGVDVTDYHAIRADRGCNNDYREVPGRNKKSRDADDTSIFDGDAPMLCCCKPKK